MLWWNILTNSLWNSETCKASCVFEAINWTGVFRIPRLTGAENIRHKMVIDGRCVRASLQIISSYFINNSSPTGSSNDVPEPFNLVDYAFRPGSVEENITSLVFMYKRSCSEMSGQVNRISFWLRTRYVEPPGNTYEYCSSVLSVWDTGSHCSSVLSVWDTGSHCSSVLSVWDTGSHCSSVLSVWDTDSHCSSVLSVWDTDSHKWN
jgi:hypothetical protein